jgi:hypothetical protein
MAFTPPVGSGHSGERSYGVFQPQGAYDIAGLKAAPGMGDNIYLFGPGFCQHGEEVFFKDFSIGFNSPPGVCPAIINNNPLFRQIPGYPAPVIDAKSLVPKPRTVNHKERVF